MALSCTAIDVYDFEKCCDLEIIDRGHSMSPKVMVPFESLGEDTVLPSSE